MWNTLSHIHTLTNTFMHAYRTYETKIHDTPRIIYFIFKKFKSCFTKGLQGRWENLVNVTANDAYKLTKPKYPDDSAITNTIWRLT